MGLALAPVVLAQGLPTATLSGRVRNDALDLPGVTVTAKSPALQGTRTTVTGANGDYVLANLPPGDYQITFAIQGFKAQTLNKTLGASQQASLDANLAMTVTATTTVTAQSDSISQSPAQATTYTGDVLSKLPTARTVTSAVNLSPGVNQNGPNGASISGAQSTENLYTVNGVTITDNVRSSPNNLFIEDAIQETTTTTSSVSAEYGRFTGGVINTITKSGGNVFSGSFRSTLNNNAWNSTSGYRTATGVNPQEDTFTNTVTSTYEATLGGPILKDMLWFFGAGRYFDTSEALTSLTRFTNLPYTNGAKETRYEGKLTFSPVQNHTLTGSYIGVKHDDVNYYFTSIPVSDLASIYDRQLPQELMAFNYNGVLSSNFFLEGSYSKRKFTFENSGGRYQDNVQGHRHPRPRARRLVQRPDLLRRVRPRESRQQRVLRQGHVLPLDVGRSARTTSCSGYDNFAGQRLSNNYQSGSNFVAYTFRPASIVQGANIYPVIKLRNTELDYWPVLQASQGSNLRTQSAFLNDAWRLNDRLSFNIGVRYDKNDATDAARQRHVRRLQVQPAPRRHVRRHGQRQPARHRELRVSTSRPCRRRRRAAARRSPAPGRLLLVLRRPRHQHGRRSVPQLAAGAHPEIFELVRRQRLPPEPPRRELQGPAGRRAVHRRRERPDPRLARLAERERVRLRSRGQLRQVDPGQLPRRLRPPRVPGLLRPPEGHHDRQGHEPVRRRMYDLGLVENSNDYRREYTGLHSQVFYRITPSFTLGANWTWSHLIGDIVGETSGSGPVRGGSHVYPEYFQRSWNNPIGDLSQDERHRVRVYGNYDLPIPASWGSFNLGFIQTYDTGTPYGAAGTIRTRSYVTNPGYLTPPASVAYYFTARDAVPDREHLPYGHAALLLAPHRRRPRDLRHPAGVQRVQLAARRRREHDREHELQHVEPPRVQPVHERVSRRVPAGHGGRRLQGDGGELAEGLDLRDADQRRQLPDAALLPAFGGHPLLVLPSFRFDGPRPLPGPFFFPGR